MAARLLALLPELDHPSDFGEGQPRRLGALHKPDPLDHIGRIVAISVGVTVGLIDQTSSFVVPESAGGEPAPLGDRTDTHASTLSLDLLLWVKVYTSVMKITLLYFDDCPNWLDAAARLDELAERHRDLVIEREIVDTEEEAQRRSFRGSPSILVDGVDVFASADDPIGLSCRMYPTPQGYAGAPTIEQLEEAIDARRACC